MATTVFPEDGTAGGTAANFISMFNALALGADFVDSGALVTDAGGVPALRWVNVSAFTVLINGVWITSDAVQQTRCANNDTSRVYIDSAGVVQDQLSSNSLPSNAIELAAVVISGGTITSISYDRDIENEINVYKRQKLDQPVNNSTTLVASTDLNFPVLAGQVWEFIVVAQFDANGSAVPDAKMSTNQTKGSVVSLFIDRDGLGSTEDSVFADIAASVTVQLAATDTGNGTFEGTFTAEADEDFEFKFAQNTAFAGDVDLKANSFLIARRVRG